MIKEESVPGSDLMIKWKIPDLKDATKIPPLIILTSLL